MENKSCHHCHDEQHKSKPDWFFRITASLLLIAYAAYWFMDGVPHDSPLVRITHSVVELLHQMWWGVLIGILMVALLSRIPKELVMAALGRGGSTQGVLRATLCGVLMDLCSHGILMVGMQLYRRGASVGQVMAFLIASPWNSLSLTFILVALIGLKWTLAFIFLSMAIAIASGLLFDGLVKRGVLPGNPNSIAIPEDFHFWQEARQHWKQADFSLPAFRAMLIHGAKESKMVLRWIGFGVLLASLMRGFLDAEQFQHYFGPTLAGLGLTLLAATIIEVCSEGSTPIAADILTRAAAPGNSFAFLMTGVSTDYTEIMSIKDTTASWKIALFLPLVTVPQIIMVGLILNGIGV